MIKTNCELPLETLFSKNMELNDYDFVLFHLYQSHPAYREYYKTVRRMHPERVMIFDNSAYEYFVKGEKLDMKAFQMAVIDLNPTYYILPDVLMDKDATLQGLNDFCKHHLPSCDSEPIAIIQGKTEEEMLECMQVYLDEGVENIGIPFHNSFYCDWVKYDWQSFLSTFKPDKFRDFPTVMKVFKEFAQAYKIPMPCSDSGVPSFNDIPKDIQYAVGRVDFIKRNIDELKKFSYVHILGSHCPFEIKFYKDFNTMDTGYPVKLALVDEELGRESEKPNIIIDDFLEKPINKATDRLIWRNIKIFKSYLSF